MVWIPDPIVTDYFTRDTEPDASNRARHHCNACSLVFPKGNNASMREHLLLPCPSLTPSTLTSIATRIAAERTTPKRVTRDPRWTKNEEQTLLSLDANIPSGKREGKYQIMAGQIGRSAQACRQKLIHLKENQAVKTGAQETTKRVLWNRKAKSSKGKVKGEEDAEEEFAFKDVQPVRTTRSRKVAFRLKVEDEGEEGVSPKSRPAKRVNDTDATVSKPSIPKLKGRSISTTAQPTATISPAAEDFLRLMRWHIHSALTNGKVVRGFYTSDQSIESGWSIFVASNIPDVEKDAVVARLIGLWLDGLDTESFEREIDARIESVVMDMSEWAFEKGNPMSRAIEELSTDEEDSGYDGDSNYEDDGHEAMEL
jgi:hypothetical protein